MSTKPFSIRLTFEERARLERAAGNKPLGEYIRLKLLGEDAKARKAVRRPKNDQKTLAQILAALGSSSLGPSLRELAHAAKLGALAESPETVSEINAACADISAIRSQLISALGLKPDGPP
ncbi:MAG: hypothetical protein AAFP79_10055 [Pseudomonadota bacterium]